MSFFALLIKPRRKAVALRDGVCLFVCRLKRVLVGHWPNWPSSAAVAHGRQHRFAAGPSVRKDQYALATDEQTNKLKNKQTDKQKDICKLYGEC